MPSTGSDKHHVQVSGHEYTVGQLQQTLKDITQVPLPAQKIIFKGMSTPPFLCERLAIVPYCVGKTLQDEAQKLSALGMKQDSKLILLGRKARPTPLLSPCLPLSIHGNLNLAYM